MSEVSQGAAPSSSAAPATGQAPAQGGANASKEATPSENTQSTAAEIRKHKLKIDGKELEVDEEELKRGYQVRKVSDRALREGQAAKKQAEEFVRLLKADPVKVLKDPRIGVDMRKLAEEYLASSLQEEMMDPRDRELRDAKAKLKEIEELNKKAESEAQEKRNKALQAKHSESYTKEIVEALGSSGLPKTEHTVKRMAYYMHQSLKIGQPMTAKEVTSLVREDYINETKSLYSGLDADALIGIVGDELANKIRKHDVSRLKGNVPGLSTPKEQSTREPSNRQSGMSPTEFRKFIKQKNS